MRGMQYYKEKYSLGLVDVANSLSQYNEFLHNLGEEKTLEETVAQLLKNKKKVRVLDIGCGNAGALKDLKKKFGQGIETVGLDLVAFPKKNADVQFVGNALEINWPADCDLIVSFRSLHEIGNAEKMLQKTAESLAKNGVALLAFRLRSIAGHAMEWAGDMQETDEQFLFKTAQEGKFEHCTVFGRILWENRNGKEKTATGIFIKVKKE